MDRKEAEKIYDYLRAYYVVMIPKEVMVDVYVNEFGAFPFNLVMNAVKLYCRTNKFPPSVEHVREYLLKLKWIAKGKIIDHDYAVMFNDRYKKYIESGDIEAKKVLSEEELKKCKEIKDTLEEKLNGFGKEWEC